MKFVEEIIIENNLKNNEIKISTGGLFVSKSRGIASGITLIADILKKQNSKNTLYLVKEDGDLIKNGDVLLSVRGNYSELMMIKNVCQNLFSELCGVSSTILKFQEEIKDLNVELLFFEHTLPGIGFYYNEAIKNAKGKIIDRQITYLDASIWNSDESIHKILESFDDDVIYVEVNNFDEFQKLQVSKCTHIVCNNFTLQEIELVVMNNNYKKIIIKNNMTYAGIRSYANKKVDGIIINNFFSQIKKNNIEFHFFEK